MNRGFGFYFGNAMKTSASTIWKKGNIFKFFAYFFMEFVARITLIFSAIFDLANVRQAKIAQNGKEIDIPQSFKIACRRESLRTMIMCIIVEALIFIAGILIISAGSGILYAIGYIISLFVDTVSPQLLTGIFLAPGALVMLVYFVIMPLMFVPTPYIVETNPDISVADTISICFNTMKSRGKFTYFLNLFIPALVEGAIISVGYVSTFLVNLFVEDFQLATVLNVVLILIVFITFILVVPMFVLARRISNKSLFEDIVLDPVNATRRTNGVNIKKCKGVKFDPSAIENELVLLFDETYDDSIPVPVSPAEARRREKEAKMREKAAKANAAPAQQIPVQPVQPVPEWKPADRAEVAEVNEPLQEDEEELITVSDVIGEPMQEEAPVEEVLPTAEDADDTAEETQPEIEEVPAHVEQEEQPAEEQPSNDVAEEPEEEVKEEKPEPKKATASTKSTAAKSTASKSTAKPTATKTAAKTATKTSTASKPTVTKTAASKTASKSTAAKSTAAKATASKTAAAKKSTTAKTSK